MFYKELSQIGLNIGESKVYYCLLREGELSATEIAKETGLGRTNVYEYATTLNKKGLVSSFERKRKTFFKAENPNELTQLVQKQMTAAKQTENIFSNLLPRLERLYQDKSDMPSMNSLIGDAGYKEFCDALYLKGDNTEVYIYLRNLNDFEPAHPLYRNKIQSRGLHINLFACKGDEYAEFAKRDERENRTTILKDLNFDIDLAIAEDKVYIGSFSSEKFAVSVIRNLAFASLLINLLRSVVKQ